jgi:multidrug efflux pump subunit AcrA (membrane-fusion protein)
MEIRAEVENKTLSLRPNMFARMTIDSRIRQIIAIPSSALQQNGDVSLVYVQVSPHTFVERRVTVGVSNGKYVEILSGLTPGEHIATQGTLALKGRVLERLQ